MNGSLCRWLFPFRLPISCRPGTMVRVSRRSPARQNERRERQGLVLGDFAGRARIAVQSGERPHQQIRILDLRNKTESTLKLPNWSMIWSSSWAADGNALFASVSHMTSYQIVRIELNGKTAYCSTGAGTNG